MPLTSRDRKFLQAVDRLKVYLLVIAVGMIIFVLVTPMNQMHAATSLIGIVLCVMFGVTQQLLSFITILDMELSRLSDAVLRSMPEEQRREFLRSK